MKFLYNINYSNNYKKGVLAMHVLYYIGIIIIAGLIMGKIASHFKLPHITGYLLAGIIIGPNILRLSDIPLLYFSL